MSIDRIAAAIPPRPADRTPAVARAPAIAADAADGAAKAQRAAPSLAQVDEAVARLNQSSQAKSQGLEFSVDSDSKRTVVKVVDQDTKEVLRQIPTQEALDIAKALSSTSRTGMLIRQTA